MELFGSCPIRSRYLPVILRCWSRCSQGLWLGCGGVRTFVGPLHLAAPPCSLSCLSEAPVSSYISSSNAPGPVEDRADPNDKSARTYLAWLIGITSIVSACVWLYVG